MTEDTRVLPVVTWAALVALGARLSVPVPGTDVPQSAQTLAVVLAGAFLGGRGGALALFLYLAAGAVGLPVFADGAAGAAHLIGPTAGYLVGFVVAAAAVGTALRAWGTTNLPIVVAVFLAGHALLLVLGWARLAFQIGATAAWAGGVVPFLWGGVAKSVIGGVVVAAYRLVRRRSGRITDPTSLGDENG